MGNHTHKAELSLARRLVRTVLAIYLGIAFSITSTQLFLEYSNEKKRFINEIGKLAETFQPIIVQGLWNLDEDQIGISLQAILGTNSDVLKVEIKSIEGEIDYSVNRKSKKRESGYSFNRLIEHEFFSSSNNSMMEDFNFHYKLTFIDDYTGPQSLGELIFVTNSHVILKRVAPIFFITLISALMKTVVLAVIFYWVLNRMVGRPMNMLSKAMRGLDPNQSSEAQDVDEITPAFLESRDEIGVALNTFQSMREAIKCRDSEIAEYQTHLEEKIAEGTKKVEDVFKAKSDFLANMSHEIRTPMNGVLGIAKLLSETPLNPQQERYLDIIENSGTTLLKTINGILDHLKIEAGKVELDYRPFSLKSVVDNCTGLFAYQAKSVPIELSSSIQRACPECVLGDSTRVQQILTNLLSNAFKFTQSGSITLSLSKVKDIDSENVVVRFLVKDTGIGIEKDKINELFMPFNQADSSTTRNYGGTGLGLSISKQLAELMGGVIRASSDGTSGSSFWVDLPFKVEVSCPLTLDSVKSLEAVNSAKADGDYKEIRVLVAEDNAVNQIVIDGILRKQGVSATIVDNGRKAVDACLYAEKAFDLVLMDCEMPVMDGWEATKAIRLQNYKGRNGNPILIYALSAHTKDRFLDEATESGMDGYLFKPIVVGQIVAILDGIVESLQG